MGTSLSAMDIVGNNLLSSNLQDDVESAWNLNWESDIDMPATGKFNTEETSTWVDGIGNVNSKTQEENLYEVGKIWARS